jgi:hypothetical protein
MSLPEYITINGTNYSTAKLNDEARNQVLNVQVADAEIARLQQKLAIVQTARNAYTSALLGAVKAGTPETPAAAPAAAKKPRKPRASKAVA